MILVDTNVLLDVAGNDPQWVHWSLAQLDRLSLIDQLVVNPVIYAELSVGYKKIEEVEAVLSAVGLDVLPIPREALFLAGKVFRAYRQRGGAKSGVLPDFFIGAHAAVEGFTVLTRDPRRYRSSFPALPLISP